MYVFWVFVTSQNDELFLQISFLKWTLWTWERTVHFKTAFLLMFYNVFWSVTQDKVFLLGWINCFVFLLVCESFPPFVPCVDLKPFRSSARFSLWCLAPSIGQNVSHQQTHSYTQIHTLQQIRLARPPEQASL